MLLGQLTHKRMSYQASFRHMNRERKSTVARSEGSLLPGTQPIAVFAKLIKRCVKSLPIGVD